MAIAGASRLSLSSSIFITSRAILAPKLFSRTTRSFVPMASSAAAASIPSPSKKVLVPIGFGTEEIEATVIVDILRRAGADVLVASVEQDLQVEASRHVKLMADDKIESCDDKDFDLIALPGGMPGSSRLRDSEPLKKLTVAQSEKQKLVAAICAAPAVALQEWGLLEGRTATCHPSFIDKLRSSLTVGSKVQRDGHITTSRGPGTAIDFALALVEQLYGKEKYEEVYKPLVLQSKTGNESSKESFNEQDWKASGSPHGGMPGAERLRDSEVLKSLLVKQAADKRAFGAICAAPAVVLEAYGLLKEKKATCHPAFVGKLSDQSAAEVRVVIDGQIITSRGPGTAMEFALSIVELYYGEEKAESIAEALVFQYPH